MKGNQGEKGEKGDKGPQGPPGMKGDPVSYLAVFTYKYIFLYYPPVSLTKKLYSVKTIH